MHKTHVGLLLRLLTFLIVLLQFEGREMLVNSEESLHGNNSKLPQMRRIPAFIIIGAQKCGTTSMYEYLCQHSLVVPNKVREAHFFDRFYNRSIGDHDHAHHRKHYKEFFPTDELKSNHSLITGESSPSYMLHTHTVLPRMQRICPWAKLIVMLRNPTDRAFSQYQMMADMTGSSEEELSWRRQSSYYNRTFDDVIREEIKFLQESGISPTVADEVWREKVLKFVPTLHGVHSIVARGLYVLQLRMWLAQWPKDQIQIYTMTELKGLTNVQHTMNSVFDYLHLPHHTYTAVEAKNSRKYEPMSAESRTLLDSFYAPYNEALFQLLDKKLDW